MENPVLGTGDPDLALQQQWNRNPPAPHLPTQPIQLMQGEIFYSYSKSALPSADLPDLSCLCLRSTHRDHSAHINI